MKKSPALIGCIGPETPPRRNIWIRRQQAHLLDFYEHNESNPVSREVTAEWLEKETLTEISWSDDANALLRDKHESITANEVHFSGVMLRFLQFTGSGI